MVNPLWLWSWNFFHMIHTPQDSYSKYICSSIKIYAEMLKHLICWNTLCNVTSFTNVPMWKNRLAKIKIFIIFFAKSKCYFASWYIFCWDDTTWQYWTRNMTFSCRKTFHCFFRAIEFYLYPGSHCIAIWNINFLFQLQKTVPRFLYWILHFHFFPKKTLRCSLDFLTAILCKKTLHCS